MQQPPKIDTAYFDVYNRCYLTPEQRLVCAIIRRAIFDAYAYLTNSQHRGNSIHGTSSDTKEAYLWLNSTNTNKYSFVWWCNQANLNHSYLQTKIKSLKYKLDKLNSNKNKIRYRLKIYQ